MRLFGEVKWLYTPFTLSSLVRDQHAFIFYIKTSHNEGAHIHRLTNINFVCILGNCKVEIGGCIIFVLKLGMRRELTHTKKKLKWGVKKRVMCLKSDLEAITSKGMMVPFSI